MDRGRGSIEYNYFIFTLCLLDSPLIKIGVSFISVGVCVLYGNTVNNRLLLRISIFIFCSFFCCMCQMEPLAVLALSDGYLAIRD
jgi:hypothetical protein